MRTLLVVISLSLASATNGWTADPAVLSDLSALGWMAGSWVLENGDSKLEETWLTPSQDSMVGMNRTVKNGHTVGFEYLRIETEDDGIVYLASPGGRCPPTPFKLVEVDGERAVFANPAHDFPQRIIYRREGDDLFARIEGTVDGETRSSEWSWHLAQ